MGIRRALLAVAATAIGLALLLSFKPHDVTATRRPPAATAASGGTSTDSSSTDSTATGGTATGNTVTGDAVDTRWGPVQVGIKVANGKITNVEIVQAPNENRRDVEINDQALPILTQETLSAQSAQIDMVSGATYTSDGYIRSLQSAIDRAGL
jgi:uncharacterized protein with FMN-binding domain